MSNFQTRTGAVLLDGDQGSGKTFFALVLANAAVADGPVLWVSPVFRGREEILPEEVGELDKRVDFLPVHSVAELETAMIPGRYSLVVIDGINVILDADELATSLSDLHADQPSNRRQFKRPGNLELARRLAVRAGSRVLATVTSTAED
jgi:hypothetical protein